MDLLNYVISIAMLALAVQFGEMWIVLGLAMILIVAARSIKVSILIIVSVIALYVINGMGMKDYWLIVVLGLIVLGYILGVGKEEEGASADPYAALLGGGMGGMA